MRCRCNHEYAISSSDVKANNHLIKQKIPDFSDPPLLPPKKKKT